MNYKGTSPDRILREGLTKKGYRFTDGQVDFILNSISFLGKPYGQLDARLHLQDMIDFFLDMGNKTKFQSDFNQL